MKHHDGAVEKVLAGLGRIEIPDGLERRVLKGARDRVEMRSRSRWGRRGLVPALLCGLTLVVVGIVGARHWLGGGGAMPREDVARAMPRVGSQQAMPLVIPMPLEATAWPTRKKVRRERIMWEQDSVALDEMRAASKVAPPLPLTEQEKMLLRIVHQGDPEELALLSPEMRLRQDEEGNAEFQRFFSSSGAKADQKQ